jgi:hypothetical protein
MRRGTHWVKPLWLPWAEPGSQSTAAVFDRLAVHLLRECSVTGVVQLLRISWDEGSGIKARAVKPTRPRPSYNGDVILHVPNSTNGRSGHLS